jgi:TP901 family phage tail tape measure protein
MNSYQLSANDMIGVVDKLTTTDNVSATSVSELNTALGKTASSAKGAGVPLQDLISYIATISSTTRQSAGTVGTGLNSIFSRYESIKMGKSYDPDNNPFLLAA